MILVDGAGRSGTSAATRGIQALGVDLGGRLKPGNSKNAKGFFEDQDLILINYRLREALGLKRSGAMVSILPPERFEIVEVQPILEDAVRLIRERFGRCPVWGFKGGGVLSLLPFWERVFEATEQSVSYVLALRNPLSVAQSRTKVSLRRGIQENSDLEFLARVVPYFRRAAQGKLSVLEYDLLLANPRAELRRVAGELDLPLNEETDAALNAYATEFLSPELRHHSFNEDDFFKHPRLNPLARDAYLALRRLATGEWSLASDAFWNEWTRIEAAHAAMAPALRHIDALEVELRQSLRGPAGAFVYASQLLRKWRPVRGSKR